MLFNSFSFFIFFPVITIGYFLLPFRYRWLWLLLASCIFYMAFVPVYILILFFTIIIDYIAGIMIEKTLKHKRSFLIISIAANVGVLSFFKYFNFLSQNLHSLGELIGWNYSLPALSIILPIGLSFHTFQAMSYTIEVYRGKQKAERHLGIYALYVMYYPQLVAGPIERPQNVLPQLHIKHNFETARVVSGLRLILWGLFKKMVIADNLAAYVNPVYSSPQRYSGITLIIATFFFAYQIYCDFSGYSDIARGCSRVMGIELMKNFDRPYASGSISEFWKRWHISLSTWFRDYLYIPLGGNRVSAMHVYFNLLLVFIISGLWHGANWTFVVWGLLHGVYLVTSLLLRRKEKPLVSKSLVNIITTFLLVCFAWIFFRADSVTDAVFIIKKIFLQSGSDAAKLLHDAAFRINMVYLNADRFRFILLVELIVGLEIIQYLLFARSDFKNIFVRKPALRWAGYTALFAAIILLGRFGSDSFIYFQF